ncbi:hypothetical protein SI65_03328 [Aspergillus cristatus]|uniref:Uncharacterized protein n=1 Tax=Aspergillus cristatus TaxID=573508 RepID=A0A1E3BH16_ASPCR|nr:hypothetical protein SI65_03328 [Aspergillus cristatus]
MTLWRSLRALQVYGANTDVGKTIVSTILCRSIQRQNQRAAFLKPVSTGDLSEADDGHLRRFGAGTITRCLYQFDEPVSPHLAVNEDINDDTLLRRISSTLSDWHRTGINLSLVETAGGVHSPGPNGNSQADLYRPLRLPVVLIADSRLGGISSSISAYESLVLRGYDVQSVLLFRDDYYQNHQYLRDYFQRKNIPLRPLPGPPGKEESAARDEENMDKYYEGVARGDDITSLLEEMGEKHKERLERLDGMADRAHELVWYPFTQHQGMAAKDIGVIDSAYDDNFQVYSKSDAENGQLHPTFDASASWWTQGLGHGNPDLSLSAAYAAGRYGHVMFAGNVHEPALQLAERLLQTLGNPRLQKVFYTDNGSTGMEVAVKMGLRAASVRYGWNARQDSIQILGLKGSYHGDTMGVMDCSEPSTYNQKVEWYRGRGYWFDFPLVTMTNGVWKVRMGGLGDVLGSDLEFPSLQAVFDLDARVRSEAAQRYREFINQSIQEQVQKGVKFGALILEPVLLGAGGMLFCDPLFQRCLVDVVRSQPELFHPESQQSDGWSGLPVIFDEVFTGLHRLGRRTAASFLGVHPDITVNAKLLTGGLVPLCTTLASKEIFDVFSSPEKSDALLHGHSYTAHAVGCQVAVDTLQSMATMERGGFWDVYRRDWQEAGAVDQGQDQFVWSLWSPDLVTNLSRVSSVEGIFALGTVLSISLRDAAGGGYTSTAAKGLQQKLSAANVHSRVLGNVLYLMASLTTKPASLRALEDLLRRSLA